MVRTRYGGSEAIPKQPSAVLDLTKAIPLAAASGAEPARLEAARTYQRRAQFLADFIEAENSMGFHADQEAARVFGLSINYARLGTAALYAPAVPVNPPPLLPPPPQTVAPPEAVRGRVFAARAGGELARPGAGAAAAAGETPTAGEAGQ
jgi:hypothetical protein